MTLIKMNFDDLSPISTSSRIINPTFSSYIARSMKKLKRSPEKVENRLMRSQKKSQSKVHSKRLQQRAKEDREYTGSPEIDALSRRLSAKSSPQIPPVKLNLNRSPKKEPALFEVDLSKWRIHRPSKETPPLKELSPMKTSNGLSYESIHFHESSRLSGKTKTQTKQKARRTMSWLSTNSEITTEFQSFFEKEKNQQYKTPNGYSRRSEKVIHPVISPSFIPVSYSAGFNLRKLADKAKPMVNYLA